VLLLPFLLQLLGKCLGVEILRIVHVDHRQAPRRMLDDRAIAVTDIQKMNAQHP
jgi:hypothetical protein